MRIDIQAHALMNLLKELGKHAKSPGRIYLTGGATAVLLGFRSSTVDLDLKLTPEPAGIFDTIRVIKDTLHVNIELASPDDFIPALPDWEKRSLYIDTFNNVDFYHYDFYAQALAKIERGHGRDIQDVRSLLDGGYIQKETLLRLFESIVLQLNRYPALSETGFRKKVEAFLG